METSSCDMSDILKQYWETWRSSSQKWRDSHLDALPLVHANRTQLIQLLAEPAGQRDSAS